MRFFKEFKEFAVRGNAIDMAVGIIIGAAFGAIVKSMVDDVIMPSLGRIFGKIDYTNLFITLSDGSYSTLKTAKEAGAITLNYGLFLNAVISFLLVAGSVFIMIKVINKLKRPEIIEATTKLCPFCQMEINLKATRCPHCTSEIK
ncbi:MAG: large conductance mechanosensitive channel protein MscL [Candidatus Falkowbacteria bacterium]